MKQMSQRQIRVAEEVRHAVAPALLRGDAFHTTLPADVLMRLNVTAVWVSPDLRLARLYVTVPPEYDVAEVLATADAQLAAPLRKLLGNKLAGKNIPSLSFHLSEEVR